MPLISPRWLPELVSWFIYVWQTLLKYESLFQLIHITDQNTDRILCVHTPHAFALAIALVTHLLFLLRPSAFSFQQWE